MQKVHDKEKTSQKPKRANDNETDIIRNQHGTKLQPAKQPKSISHNSLMIKNPTPS